MTKKLKIAIVSMVWKRPHIFEIFAQSLLAFDVIKNVEFTVIIAGSEGDTSRKMVEKHGFTYIEIPNQPLAEKANAPLAIAKKLNVDYCFCLGSDDLMSVNLMEHYIMLMQQGFDFIGITDFYFIDSNTHKAAYWAGYREKYRQGATCGAGRVISKRLLNIWNWRLWDTKHNLILDNSIDERLRQTPHTQHVFSLKNEGLIGIDVKSSTNMTPFKLWDNTVYLPYKQVWDDFLAQQTPKMKLQCVA